MNTLSVVMEIKLRKDGLSKMRFAYITTIEGNDMYNYVINNHESIFKCFENIKPDISKASSAFLSGIYTKQNYGDRNIYYAKGNDAVVIYEELPPFENDAVFKWVDFRKCEVSIGGVSINVNYCLREGKTSLQIFSGESNVAFLSSLSINCNGDILKTVAEILDNEEKRLEEVQKNLKCIKESRKAIGKLI